MYGHGGGFIYSLSGRLDPESSSHAPPIQICEVKCRCRVVADGNNRVGLILGKNPKAPLADTAIRFPPASDAAALLISSPPIGCTLDVPFFKRRTWRKPVFEIDLIPPQRAELRRSQPTPICNEDHRRVAVAISPAPPRTLNELFHLLDHEAFAWPALCIEKSPQGFRPACGVRRTPALPAFRR